MRERPPVIVGKPLSGYTVLVLGCLRRLLSMSVILLSLERLYIVGVVFLKSSLSAEKDIVSPLVLLYPLRFFLPFENALPLQTSENL